SGVTAFMHNSVFRHKKREPRGSLFLFLNTQLFKNPVTPEKSAPYGNLCLFSIAFAVFLTNMTLCQPLPVKPMYVNHQQGYILSLIKKYHPTTTTPQTGMTAFGV
ncbi:hypothetical protein ACVGWJ_00185, partial [Enterobacter hormaechei]